MSWQAGFCVTYEGVRLRCAFAYRSGLWWALDDLCTLFRIPVPAILILLDLDPSDKADLHPYQTQVVNSAALHPWVDADELDRFHTWIRGWLFPVLGQAFTSETRNATEAMAILHQKGVVAWPVADDDERS